LVEILFSYLRRPGQGKANCPGNKEEKGRDNGKERAERETGEQMRALFEKKITFSFFMHSVVICVLVNWIYTFLAREGRRKCLKGTRRSLFFTQQQQQQQQQQASLSR
jgi:hypothetical protein